MASLLSDCDKVVISDGKTVVELSGKDVVITEQATAFRFVVLDSAKLRVASQLNSPTIKLCYQGTQMVAYGNPVFSSAIPKGAEAFYPLSQDNKIMFVKGSLRVLIVKKLFTK